MQVPCHRVPPWARPARGGARTGMVQRRIGLRTKSVRAAVSGGARPARQGLFAIGTVFA